MKKFVPPKYKKGDKVLLMAYRKEGEEVTIKDEPQYNGRTYMYSFEESDLRCGEQYLSRPKGNKNH